MSPRIPIIAAAALIAFAWATPATAQVWQAETALTPVQFVEQAAKDVTPVQTPETAAPVETASLDMPVMGRAAIPALMASQPNIIADLSSAVSPAVVNIRVTADSGKVVSEGHGSGFVISSKGEVVTNHHVIDEGTRIQVEFNNGVKFDADIVGTDPETDIALLQIQSDQTFPTTQWHDPTPLRIGEFVVPIGNPFGIGQSVSFGIISAIGRERVDSGSYVDYIQTDATVNTGNSGGPLFDLEGKVVGVNSAIYSPTGASVGIAFAIPHHTAQDVIETLRRDGKVARGFLGVNLRTGSYSDGRSGAIVDSLVPGGPAKMAGLQVEDIIMSVNGVAVSNGHEATRQISAIGPNKQARFEIERAEKMQAMTATLTLRPEKDVLEQKVASLPSATDAPVAPLPYPGGGSNNTGISLVDLSAQFRSAIGMSYDQVGVYVEAVRQGTHASAMGFKTGQVLLEFDMEPISSVSAFNSMIAKAKEQGKLDALVKVRTKNGSETYVTLPIV